MRLRAHLVLLLVASTLAAAAPSKAYDGCTSLPGSFPGREVVQVSLDVLLAGACAVHDACYRSCVSIPYNQAHKASCDLTLLTQLNAWCFGVSAAQELLNIGISGDQFIGPCLAAMFGAYAAVSGPIGQAAFFNDQFQHCDPCSNGSYEVSCLVGGGLYWESSSCTCVYNNCHVSPETISNCYAQGGAWQDAPACSCWGDGSSPILIDFSGNGLSLSGPYDGVAFDLNADRKAERIAWTTAGSDDAFLAFDRNLNGKIDDGYELFGTAAPQRSSGAPNGFAALAELDLEILGGNGNDKIDAGDLLFPHLRLWLDADHDGLSKAAELWPLWVGDVAEIDLAYRESRRVDEHGNEMRFRSVVTLGSGKRRVIYDVFFAAAQP